MTPPISLGLGLGVTTWYGTAAAGGGSSPSASANPYFDGTNDFYYTAGGYAATLTSNKLMCISVLFQMDSGGASSDTLWAAYTSGGALRAQMNYTGTNRLQFQARNAAGSDILLANMSLTRAALSVPVHCLFVCDLANAANRCVYLNGTDLAASFTWTTYSDDTIDWAGVDSFIIGATNTGTLKWQGCVAELWIANQYPGIDAAALANFYDAGALDLGADGTNPTGVQPPICLNNATLGSWNVNGGDAGNLTLTGATTACAL